MRPKKIPLPPPLPASGRKKIPKGEVKASTAKRPQTRVRIARTTVALLLRSSIIVRLDRLLVFLLIAGIEAMLTRRLRVPYSVGLVLTGIVLSLFLFFADVLAPAG